MALYKHVGSLFLLVRSGKSFFFFLFLAFLICSDVRDWVSEEEYYNKKASSHSLNKASQEIPIHCWDWRTLIDDSVRKQRILQSFES